MAYLPSVQLSTTFTQYPGYWLKFYIQGTLNPLAMATDAAAGTLLARAEISSGGTTPIGFVKTAGDAIFQPYLNAAYDGWIFPTFAEADANDTSNAIRIADNVDLQSTEVTLSLAFTKKFDTVALMAASTTLEIGDFVITAGYTAQGDGGGNSYAIVTAGTGTDDGGSFIDLSTHQAKGIFDGTVNVRQFGASGNGVTDDKPAIQAAIDVSQGVRGRAVYLPAGTYGIKSNLDITSDNTRFGLRVYGDGYNASLLTLIAGFSGAGDTNCIFLIDGTSMSNHRKSWVDMSIADNSGIASSGFEAVKLINRAFELDFTRIWFTTSKTHLSISQDSLGPNVYDCVFDLASNASIKDRSFKPGTYVNCIFVSSATANSDIEMIYDTGSPFSVWDKSFGGSIEGCLFLNPFRAITLEGNKGANIGASNKFACTSADVNRFIQASDCDSVNIEGTFFRRNDTPGNISSNALGLSNVLNSKITVILDNIDADGLNITDCDGSAFDVTATDVTGNVVLFSSTQTNDTKLTGVFTRCGTVSTKNVIQCASGLQTRVVMSDMIFASTVGDNDIEATGNVLLLDNQYSSGVLETSFTGINRPTDIFPVRPSADLNDIGNEINTTFKREGKMVFSSNVNKPVWALGSSAASVWIDAAGVTQHTPV